MAAIGRSAVRKAVGARFQSSVGQRTPQAMIGELEAIFRKQGVLSISGLSQEWFAKADVNASKGLDEQEFVEVMKNLGLKFNDSAESRKFFEYFDTDGSNIITYGEFSAALSGPIPEFSASLAFMHQHVGHYPSNLDKVRAARPQFEAAETEEWKESLEAALAAHGPTRVRFLLHELMEEATRLGVSVPSTVATPLVNTIPSSEELPYPGDLELENKISNLVRWNAAVMVSDGNKRAPGVGGHIGTFASIADFMEVAQNHIFRGKNYGGGRGDSIYVQGHSSPGNYSRAFLEGRLSLEQVMNFRQESGGKGISSYPHPRLMPDFWENPTVSMGLGPLGAVYQARYYRYLHLRGLADTSNSRVFAFIGDGEFDEPEISAAISVAGRERLNNLIFVVNCNYQRLDGPVRGNSKVVQEFEGTFRGAGFDVIKLVWGTEFNKLIEADHDGRLIVALESIVDGDCQRLHAKADGALVRKEIFEANGLLDRVAHLSDQQLLEAFNTPGGHDKKKIFNALKHAEGNAEMGGRPTVILLKTVKGYGLSTFQGRNTVHQKKTISSSELTQYRDVMNIDRTDEQIASPDKDSFCHPGPDSKEVQYMVERRRALGGFLPSRKPAKVSSIMTLPEDKLYTQFDNGSNGKALSTTMAFAGILRNMMRAGDFGKHIALMVTDESRTFGLDAFFPLFKIHAPFGQNYTPVDADQVMKYSEAPNGQILQEGISEGGAIMTWIAAATSYASQGTPTLPFLIYYSMFGFQRVGDSIWQAADMRARGFLMGGTYGRTTLNGEGLQHQDGHSLLLALTNPAVKGWDPAFGYELAEIIKHGVDEMWGQDKDVMYYITLYNGNYPHPPKPDREGISQGIKNGLYMFQEAPVNMDHNVRLVGSGAIMTEVLRAVDILKEFGVGAEVWSATNYGEMHREIVECDRLARLDPTKPAPVPWAAKCLGEGSAVTVAASDNQTAYMRLIEGAVGGEYVVLGADGFGRSDTREALRRYFEVDAENIAVGALSGLAKAGKIPSSVVQQAINKFGIASGPRPDICAV